ncbi:unnamed protein product [Rotaria socialis]|uniref:Helix-turn-helix domain-containing protein n=3 Tax=Rotaria socialis TaxID=392032 RepID=A0A821FXZ9_9BILA|nr:unnamed protein product [Rotaria socialis]
MEVISPTEISAEESIDIHNKKYVNNIFFTSNDSLESIGQMLDGANNFHPNIKLVRQIGRSVPFLDVFIQNSNGALITSVYHKAAAESYVVQFGPDHPGHIFGNTVDTAIMIAVRYSTTLSQFEEVRKMKLMFLYNGYQPRHIDWRLSTLFSKYLSKHFILPLLNNSDDFSYLLHQLLTTSTDTTYDTTTKRSTTYQTHDKNMQNQLPQPTENNEFTARKRLIIHGRHEKRLSNYQRYIHELWSRTFDGTEIINTSLNVGTYLNPNLKQQLLTSMIKHIPHGRSNPGSKMQHETDKQTQNFQANLTWQ